MSGPNTSYDPVEVAALDPRAIEDAVAEALAAAAAATSLDELKAARSAHQGDKSALALANREIGALPPSAKAEAGKRVGRPEPGSRRRSRPARPSSRPSATSASSPTRPSTSPCPPAVGRSADATPSS